MGTQFSVAVILDREQEKDKLPTNIEALLAAINREFSTYDSASTLSTFNQTPSTAWQTTSNAFCRGLEGALEVSVLTDGRFDPAIGQLVDLWGFGPPEQLEQRPATAKILAALQASDYQLLETRCETNEVRKDNAMLHVDLSGYAKGLAVDQVADLLAQHELQDYMVEIGGEIRVRGRNAKGARWRIAVEAPDAPMRQAHTALRLTDAAIATSGDYRNYFDLDGHRYTHIIDPDSGFPVSHNTASVTVVSERTAMADALATALLVMGSKTGLQFAEDLQIAALFLTRDGENLQRITSTEFGRYLEPAE